MTETTSVIKSRFVAVGKGSGLMVGYVDWNHGQQVGLLSIVGKKYWSIPVSLTRFITQIKTVNDVERIQEVLKKSTEDSQKEIELAQKYLDLLDQSLNFLKCINVTGMSKPDYPKDERLALVTFYSDRNYTLFGVWSKTALKIARDFQPFNRYHAAIKRVVDYIEIYPLPKPERAVDIDNVNKKSFCLKRLKEEQVDVQHFIQKNTRYLEMIEDMNFMLDKFEKTDIKE